MGTTTSGLYQGISQRLIHKPFGKWQTEQLKVVNAMLWVQKMNEIQSRVREIIYAEIIYA